MSNLPFRIDLENYLPEGIAVSPEKISALTKNHYYRDYYFTVSEAEISKFYSLMFIYDKKVEFDIEGTGLKFSLNHGTSGPTEIPTFS